MAKQSRKLFAIVPGKQPVQPLPPAYRNANQPTIEIATGLQKIHDQISRVRPGYQAELLDAGARYIAGSINKGGQPKNKTGGNGKNTPGPGGAITVFRDTKNIKEGDTSYALSKAPNPKDINLNSGLRPNVFANDYMVPVENGCASLHMTQTTFAIPTGTTNPVATYFKDTLCFDLQTRAQANVGFGLDIATKLSQTQLVTAFNAAIYALQVYFFYSSIMSYESDSRNKNAGMIYLRNLIDSQTLSDMSQLGKRLEDTPIPPRLVEMVRYLNGNFLSSETQGAPLLKFNMAGNMITTVPISPTYPAQALSLLTTDANNTVFTLLRRCIPQWRVGTLYDCNPIPTFDKNFLTIFTNAPSCSRPVATNVRSHSVADLVTAVPYNSYTNRLDGAAYAMASTWNTVSGEAIPGLLASATSTASYLDTHWSFYNVGGTKGFYPVVTYPFLALSRMDTVQTVGTTQYTPHLAGTDRCQNVTGAALCQSAQNTLDFLFDVNSIPTKGKLSHFNELVPTRH